MAENSPYTEESEAEESIIEELLVLLTAGLLLAAKESSFDDMQTRLQTQASKIIPKLTTEAQRVTEVSTARTEAVVGKSLSYDYSEQTFSSRIQSALSDNMSQVIATNEDMYRLLQQYAIERDWSDAELLRRLRKYYGLIPSHVTTVLNMEASLARTGASKKVIEDKVNDRIEKLIDWRFDLIADNVAVDAVEGAKDATFRYFLQTGQVDRTYVKQWVAVVDDRTSDICLGLNGTQAELDGTFEGGYLWPPAHGHCRSSVKIVKRRI